MTLMGRDPENADHYAILFEGSVFAMAEANKAARTGVYFVLLNLAEALLESLGIVTAPQNMRLLQQALSGHPLVECVDRASQIKVGEQNVAYISTFFPIHPAIKRIKRLAAFQIIHDLAFHACPALSGNMEFEKAVIALTWIRCPCTVCLTEHPRRFKSALRYSNSAIKRLLSRGSKGISS